MIPVRDAPANMQVTAKQIRCEGCIDDKKSEDKNKEWRKFMCGIIGYTGNEDVREVLLDALELLEYRGYDSAGIAVRNQTENRTDVYKCAGRVGDLRQICAGMTGGAGCGIGHTRWATHGGVSDRNAHPHRSGAVTLVHNGIIENYKELLLDYSIGEGAGIGDGQRGGCRALRSFL